MTKLCQNGQKNRALAVLLLVTERGEIENWRPARSVNEDPKAKTKKGMQTDDKKCPHQKDIESFLCASHNEGRSAQQ
jgi:hypothetical protein